MSLNVLAFGQGSPLLLLHGFTGSARTWSAQVETWSLDHRIIAPDLLGHGGSDAPGDPERYALSRQAADLAGLLRLMDAAPAAVIGYSMGSRLALVLTLQHPAMVDRLVLESPSAGITGDSARAARQVADERLASDLERDGLPAFVDQWQQMPLFASHADLAAEVQQQLRSERLSHDPSGLAASLRGAGQGAMVPLHDRLSEISVPTLVVAGALDETGSDRALVVAEGIPGAQLETIPGVGHTPHLERAHDFTRLTADFLSAAPITPPH